LLGLALALAVALALMLMLGRGRDGWCQQSVSSVRVDASPVSVLPREGAPFPLSPSRVLGLLPSRDVLRQEPVSSARVHVSVLLRERVGSRLLHSLVLVASQPGQSGHAGQSAQSGQRAFPMLPAEDEAEAQSDGESQNDRNLPDILQIPNLDQTEFVVEQIGQSIQRH
jgi:hypothetical protein